MKRVILSLVFIISVALFLPTLVHAGNYVDEGYGEAIKAAIENGDVNAQAHVSNVNTNNYSDFVRRVLGPVEGVTVSAEDMDTPYAEQMRQQSAVNTLNNYIVAIYTHPPASSYAFFQDMGQTLGFIPKQAYAQGIGFTALSPLLPVWKVFRNIAYALLAIVLLVIGFLVMFRKKIDPKTVITVQNALPKIVISLILITFSYAIVGLMIDLMYVVMYLLLSLLINAVPDAFTGKNVINSYINGSFGNLGFSQTWWGTSAKISELLSGAFWQGVSTPLIAAVVGIGLIFVYVRILLMLITAYIQIIIALIIAPVQLLFDAIPGSQGGFAAWIKSLLSHLLVFPITALLLLVGTILIKTGESASKLWTPPFLGNGSNTEGIIGLISIGILLTIPSIVKGIQESLKAKPMVNVNGGEMLGGIKGAGGLIQGAYYLATIKNAFPGKTDIPDKTAHPDMSRSEVQKMIEERMGKK